MSPFVRGETLASMSPSVRGRLWVGMIGEGEAHLPIAAEGCAQGREQRLVLIDEQELPVAERLALEGIDKAHEPNFTQERFGHSSPPAVPKSRDRSTSTPGSALGASAPEGRTRRSLRSRPSAGVYRERPAFHIDEPHLRGTVAGVERDLDLAVVAQGGYPRLR
jgi:hypothetical protein